MLFLACSVFAQDTTQIQIWDFEDEDAGGWVAGDGVESIEITDERAYTGDYSLKLVKDTVGLVLNLQNDGVDFIEDGDIVRLQVWISQDHLDVTNGFMGFWFDSDWGWNDQWLGTDGITGDYWSTLELVISVDSPVRIGLQHFLQDDNEEVESVIYVDNIEILREEKPDDEWDWQTCNNWDYKIYGNYMLRNNIWGEGFDGAGSQCIYANSEADWHISATHEDGTGMVKGYPQAVRGWVQGGIGLNYPDGSRSPFVTPDHGINQRIEDLEEFTLHHDLELPDSGRYMVLLDLYFYFTERPGLPYEDNKPDYAVMIFTNIWDDTGWMYGDLSDNELVTIGDRQWYFNKGPSGIVNPDGTRYLLAPYPEWKNEDVTLDVKEILLWLRDNHGMDGHARVSSIQKGVEIIEGGEYRINDYWTDVQGEVVSDEDFPDDVRRIWDFETPDQIDDWYVEDYAGGGEPSMELSTEKSHGGDYSLKISGNFVAGEGIALRRDASVPDDVTTFIYHVWIPQDMVDSALDVYDVYPDSVGFLQTYLMFAGWQWRSELFYMHELKGDDWNRLEFVIPEEVEDNSTIQAFGVAFNMQHVSAGETSVYFDDIILDDTPPVFDYRVQYKLASISRDERLVEFDEETTEGNLLVILSGHRFGEDDPQISNGWTRHIVATPEAGRVIAMWSKVADGDTTDIAEIDWQQPDWSDRQAWVIMQEFTGGENWQFIEAVGEYNPSEGTEITLGPTAMPGSDNMLAIAGSVYRGDVENPAYVAGDGDEILKEMEGLIHYEYAEPQDPAQVAHGSTAFLFYENGNFEWEVESSWTNDRLAVGVLGLFSLDDPVSVDDKDGTPAGIPDDYKLFDNFPNPFNPSTQIQFALPEAADVLLEVYDILGRRVTTLINNEHYGAGNHTVTWNAQDQMGRTVSSGLYIYRFQAGDFVESKRMMFLK